MNLIAQLQAILSEHTILDADDSLVVAFTDLQHAMDERNDFALFLAAQQALDVLDTEQMLYGDATHE